MFLQVHKGLKALLFETALQVQHTDFWNIDEAEDVIERINDAVRLFEKHAHSEDTLVFPAIEKYEPSVKDAFEQEHIKDHLLGQQLQQAIDQYNHADLITGKAAAGRQLQAAFLRFMVFNIEHMMKEEDVINPILWRYYTDAELHVITARIVAGIPQDYMMHYSRWMMKGLNNAEITQWLREVEKNAPEPVFQALFATAEKELSERRFRQILECLTEGAMLA
jgi:hypothetical protein